ncbi:hypothetical protein TVAG_331270 [Trichomonas vaginalis G3]|uniref:Uncharacterized protein n=1 Tax=Trichomonas vaginalis (strain ATCC PRA-98 / G3) TaxID=412133 RepID=A2FC45_TRIV3|nr:regulation of choline O-acetyltransferase protein [Trichomonas vaginalis G3]EAX97540.1 hypothetical protein TVAG_331270 [Trichomonas vaginalis G3]KAI5512940.1 regulation of choline O-acetyltransferase protein [Trichomonas vaginalis G3]|eukprot:XP_001310470.1 hypothetical protein [Trichomonas vaginalis G3]
MDVIIDMSTSATTRITCTSKGQTFKYTRKENATSVYPERTVTCPSPEQFCRTRNMLNQYFTSDPFAGVIFPTPRPTPQPTPRPTPKPTPQSTPIFDSIPEFEPIRITNDNRFFNGTYTDSQACTSVGQQVIWKNTIYTCVQEDILTAQQISAYQQTVANVKYYLETMLRVKPVRDRYFYGSDSYSKATTSMTIPINNCDLYIVWMTHPFGNTRDLNMQADVRYVDYKLYAVNQATIIFNPRLVPSKPSQVNTQNDFFFNNCLRAILSCLVNVPYFHYKLVSDYYPNPYCTIKKNGVNFTILTTPYAHHHGKHFFGQEWFVGDDNKRCPSGVIMDSHVTNRPSTAIYAQDILCPLALQQEDIPFARFTEVSMAILFDTGNYEVDWRYGKPVLYGNKEYINGVYNLNWPLGPPQTTLQKYYFQDPNNDEDASSFEFKTWGFPGKYSGTCNDGTTATNFPDYCAAQSYYNPNNYNVFGDDYDAYLLLKGQAHYCPDGTATITGLTCYTGDTCATYHCADDYQSFTLLLRNHRVKNTYETLNCTHEGQTYSYKEFLTDTSYYPRNLICLPPEAFCRTLEGYDKLYPSNPFQNALFPTPTPFVTPRYTAKETPKVTPALTPKITPVYTPRYTPKITPKSTPITTPKTTPFKTAFSTPKFTQKPTLVHTPYKTIHKTPFKTHFSTPIYTAKVTPFNTPYKTAQKTPVNTLVYTPKITPFSTAKETLKYTPKYTAKETPKLTPFITPKLTPVNTPKLTPASTAAITPFNTPFLTPVGTPCATNIYTAEKKAYKKKNVGNFMGFAYFVQ